MSGYNADAASGDWFIDPKVPENCEYILKSGKDNAVDGPGSSKLFLSGKILSGFT